MKYVYTAVSLLLLSLARAANETITSELLYLGLSSGSQIGPTSEFTQRWSSYDAPSYVTAVKPATEDDVAKIITYATKFSTPFLSTGGGHGFSTTLGRLRNGIELDLSNFDMVSVDVQSSNMTIGGAVRFRDILGPLGQAHKELPIGSESCVGMVGATLGGGVGRYNGLHGLLLDSLLSVKMVTAVGDLVTASTEESPDLFWGIRGAGFNFGTILEATYSVYNETAPQVLNADFLFASNASQGILEYFKTFESSLPAELSFILLAAYSSDFGGSSILVNVVYAGPQAEGENYLYPLFNLSPIEINLTMIPWSEINAVSFFATEPSNYTCPTDSPHNVYGDAVHQFDINTFQGFYENYAKLTSSMPVELNGTVYFIEFFPKQAVEAVPSNATAYPWRNITAHLLFNFAYNDTEGALDNRINEFATAARRNFTSVSELYVSYGHGDEDLATLYSAENLPRLRSLKAKWGPENVYSYNYPITL